MKHAGFASVCGRIFHQIRVTSHACMHLKFLGKQSSSSFLNFILPSVNRNVRYLPILLYNPRPMWMSPILILQGGFLLYNIAYACWILRNKGLCFVSYDSSKLAVLFQHAHAVTTLHRACVACDTKKDGCMCNDAVIGVCCIFVMEVYSVHSLCSTLSSSIKKFLAKINAFTKLNVACVCLCAQTCRIVTLVVDPFNFVEAIPNRFCSHSQNIILFVDGSCLFVLSTFCCVAFLQLLHDQNSKLILLR